MKLLSSNLSYELSPLSFLACYICWLCNQLVCIVKQETERQRDRERAFVWVLSRWVFPYYIQWTKCSFSSTIRMIRCVLRECEYNSKTCDYNTNDDIHIIQYFSAKCQHEYDNRAAIIFVLHANHSIQKRWGRSGETIGRIEKLMKEIHVNGIGANRTDNEWEGTRNKRHFPVQSEELKPTNHYVNWCWKRERLLRKMGTCIVYVYRRPLRV